MVLSGIFEPRERERWMLLRGIFLTQERRSERRTVLRGIFCNQERK